jgi:hypothetical protein
MDEKEDVNYYLDLSPYARKVLKDESYDKESFLLIDINDFDDLSNYKNTGISDHLALYLIQNKISERIVIELMNNKNSFFSFLLKTRNQVGRTSELLQRNPRNKKYTPVKDVQFQDSNT